MTETIQSIPLTDQALAKLRKLAEGNGLQPDKIILYGTDEKIYSLKGTLTLTPKCEVETAHYPGPAKGGKAGGKIRQVFANFQDMHSEANRRRVEFETGRGWLEASLKELKAAPGEGWGLQGAHITLPDETVILTASTGCPACRGQKLVTCPQCHGQRTFTCSICGGSRQERCYVCGGTGHNPQNPSQPCPTCGGSRMTVCRQCRGSGQMPCPACGGRGGTPCPGCRGTGLMSEDIIIHSLVETRFQLHPEGLPSGLRAGLGRLGMENLGKGHADIVQLPPPEKQEGDEAEQPDEKILARHDIDYTGTMPYADMRLNFDGHKAVVAAFGKRGVLLGVPPFLDAVLKPARDRLTLSASGKASLEDVLKTRAIREALQLELEGKGNVKEFRRLYPVGLSAAVMEEILRNIRLALKQQTLKTRGLAAIGCGLLSAAFFAALFMTGFHAGLTQGWTLPMQAGFDFAVLALPLLLSWLALHSVTRASLQKRFAGHKVATTKQAVGKTAWTLFAAIILMFVLIVWLAPTKPAWLGLILR